MSFPANLDRRTEELVDRLSVPPPGSEPVQFVNRYSRSQLEQYSLCVWRFRQAYWCE